MALFTEKTAPLDWDRVLALDVTVVEEHTDIESAGASLEHVYDALCSASVRADDPRATTENLLRLVRVAQCVMEYKHALYKDTDAEAERLDLEVQRLEAAGAGVDPSFRALRDEAASLDRRLRDSETRVARAERALEQEKARVDAAQLEAQAERSRAAALAQQVERATAEAREAAAQAAAHKEAASRARSEETDVRMGIREKNAEVNRLLNEVNVLAARNGQLEVEVETMEQELEAAVGELESKTRDQQDTHAALLASDAAVDSLRAERDAYKARAEELEGLTREKGLRVETELEEIGGELLEYKHKVSASRLELSNRETRITALQSEIADLRSQLEGKEWERLQKDVTEREETIKKLQAQLEEAYKDFETLAMDWEHVEGKLKETEERLSATSPDRSALHLRAATKLRERVKLLQQRRRADTSRIADLEERLTSLESELAQSRARCDMLESGTYGLEDARAEIRDLEVQRSFRDKDIARLSAEANAYRTKAEDLAEECDVLRGRLGMPEVDKSLTDGSRMRHYAELEELRTVNVTLRKEIDALEEERLKLKSELRLRAVEVAGRAAEVGLSGEEMMKVEEYAEALRIGGARSSSIAMTTVSTAQEHRPQIQNHQLDRLAYQLERAALDLQEERSARQVAEKSLFLLREEHRLATEALKALGKTVVEAKSHVTDETDVVERLVAVLERHQLQTEVAAVSDNASTNVSTTAVEELLRVNRALREEIRQLKEFVDEARRSEKQAEEKLMEAMKATDVARLEAKRPRKKVSEMPVELSVGGLHDIAELVEQLIKALSLLESRDRDLWDLKPALDDYFEHLKALCYQNSALYRDFHGKQTEWEEKQRDLTQKLAETKNQLSDCQSKCAEFERCVENSTQGDSGETKKLLSDLSRRNAVLFVSERAMTRKCKALESELECVSIERLRMRDDMSRLDLCARETVGRLEREKRQAVLRLKALEEALKGEQLYSVPRSDLLAVQLKLDSQNQQYKELLERETHWVAAQSRMAAAEIDVDEAILLKSRLVQAERDRKEAEQRLVNLTTEVQLLPKRDPQVLGSSELVKQVAVLSAKLENAESSAVLAERNADNCRDAEKRIRERLQEVEDKIVQISEEKTSLDSVVRNLKFEMQIRVTKDQYDRTNTALSAALERIAELELDVAKYKTSADIAAAQTTDYKHFHSVDLSEREHLRAAIRELQMEGDDKLTIGKLYNQICSLQISESESRKKLKETDDACVKLQRRLIEGVSQLESQDNTIFELKSRLNERCRELRQVRDHYRLELECAVSMEQHAKTCALLRTSIELKQKALDDLKVVQQNLHAASNEVATLSLELRLKEDLLSSLQSSPDKQKIASWHKKLVETTLANLRQQHELKQLQDLHEGLQKELLNAKKNICTLEELAASRQMEADAMQLEWERREFDLERNVSCLEEERERVYRAASADELEFAVQQLAKKARLLRDSDLKLKLLEENITELQKEVKRHQKESSNQEDAIANLKHEVSLSKLSQKPSPESKVSETQASDDDSAQMAQSTLESLQRQLEFKEGMLFKYQEMISKQNDAWEMQKERLSMLVSELNSRAVDNLQLESELQNMEPVENNTFFILIIFVQEREIDELKQKCAELHESLDSKHTLVQRCEQELQNQVNEHHQEQARMHEAVSQLQQALNAARKEAAQSPAKTTLELVKQLKLEVLKKTAVEAALTGAMTQLKTAMQFGKDQERLASRNMLEFKKAGFLEGELNKFKELAASQGKELEQLKQHLARRDTHLKRLNEEKAKTQKGSQAHVEQSHPLTVRHVDSCASVSDASVQTDGLSTSSEHEQVWRRKIEKLEGALDLKTRQVQDLQKQLEQAKMLVTKVQKQRASATSRAVSAATVKSRDEDSDTFQFDLQRRFNILQHKYDKLEREISVENGKDIARLRLENARLLAKIAELEVSDRGPRTEMSASIDEQGAVHILEKTVRDLKFEVQIMEDQKLNSDNQALEFKYERDHFISLLRRLAAECNETLKMDPNISISDSFSNLNLKGASPQTLTLLIEQLTKHVEKLQQENGVLKKNKNSAFTNTRYMHMVNELRALRKDKELAVSLDRKRSLLEDHIAKLEADASKMRTKMRLASEKSAKLQEQLSELQTVKENLLLENQLMRSKVSAIDDAEKDRSTTKEEIEKLRGIIQQKERTIQQLLRPDDQDIGVSGENRRLHKELDEWRARVAKLESQIQILKTSLEEAKVLLETERSAFLSKLKSDGEARRVLAAENVQLKEELEASGIHNPEFWEELEDLKENYKEALRLNIRYEQELQLRN
ncbi:hypothetical protein HDU93_002170 [Gonapodya sp. JEL0774]|nr:hypothetical protein HDU93_002170 [Gonapodya sp. JEL0774]